MSQFVKSESLSSMAGFNIPLLNIRDFSPDAISQNPETITTSGYKHLQIPKILVSKINIGGDSLQNLNSQGVAIKKDADNFINVRVGASGATKYLLIYLHQVFQHL